MEEKRQHWLQTSLIPSIVLIESDDGDSFSAACNRIDSSSGGLLLRLLDSRRTTKRPIEYLTPTVKLSQVFKVRVCAPTELSLGKNTSRSLDNALYQVVASKKPDRARNDLPYPWFSLFRKTLFQSSNTWREVAEESGNTLFLPLVALYAVPMAGADPAVRLTQLESKSPVPAGIPKLFLLVNDGTLSEQDADTAERLVKAEFGTENACVLRLESEQSFEESYHEILTRVVMMTQRRIFGLHETVSQQRKGLTGTIRSLFGGGASAGSKPPQAVKDSRAYAADSPTLRARTLADLLFWMRDYDGALNNYGYLRDDYQRDEAWLHLGNVHEMIAICSFLSKGLPNSYEEGGKRVELIDKAVESYIRAVPVEVRASQTLNSTQKQTALGYRLATRASLLLLDIAPRNGFSSMKVMMKPLAHEDELCAAIILEQIALLMVDHGVARRGMRRKAGFNSLLAGSLFRSLGLDQHAWRCYVSVYQNFRSKGWPAAEHHLEVNLGNLARNLGNVSDLIEYRGRCLERGYEIVHTNQHRQFLKEFCDAIDSDSVSQKRLSFHLPKVTRVGLPQAEADMVQLGQGTTAWDEMEMQLNNVVKTRKRRANRPVGYVQEELFVTLEMVNPLNCELKIMDMTLFATPSDESKVTCIRIQSETFSPKQVRQIRLCVVPASDGQLAISGVRWKLTSSSVTVFEFVFQNTVVIDILPKSPALRASVHPQDGDSKLFLVTLENKGAAPIPQGARLLICNEGIASAEWLEGQTRGEIVDERGSIQEIPLTKAVEPGVRLTLSCRLIADRATALPCVILFGDARFCRLLIPSTSTRPLLGSVSVKAKTIGCSSLERLITIEVDATAINVRPCGISGFSPAWKLTPVSAASLNYTASPFAKQWSLLVRVEPIDNPEPSHVDLSDGKRPSTFPPLTPDDFELRSFHALSIHLYRSKLRKELEREKAELEAQGKLPITIQDVRRARQRGELSAIRQDAYSDVDRPGSREALLSAKDKIHIAVEFIEENDISLMHRSFCPSVEVASDVALLSFARPVPRTILLKQDQVMTELPVTVKFENKSQVETLKHVSIVIGASKPTGADSFPRPMFWSGQVCKVVGEVAPLSSVNVEASAFFLSSGVYSLESIEAQYTLGDVTRRLEVLDTAYVAVLRQNRADDDQVFLQVDKELSNLS